MKPYIKFIKHRVKPWIPDYGQIHRPLEFAFYLGDLVCDPSKIISCVFDRGFDGLVGGRLPDEVELNRRQVWGGGAFEC